MRPQPGVGIGRQDEIARCPQHVATPKQRKLAALPGRDAERQQHVFQGVTVGPARQGDALAAAARTYPQGRIEPVVARIEAEGFTEAERADAVAELDRASSELDLSVTARMRMRIDMIDLLEGRLELGDFVARTVARQECFAVTQRVALSEQCRESIEV